ncbi:secretory phospholipase A2 receptor precursor [Aphelenchoides avenae]|nr:secretory phospholipase A2 receptor precursor [Aphelenchus avenae]
MSPAASSKVSRGSIPAQNPNVCLKKGAAASWKDAQKGCEARHGTLVSITDQNFVDFKPILNFASGSLFWVGGTNVGGVWKWSDEAPLSYAAWEEGKDRCMAVNTANGQWRALPCSTSLPYICKVADSTPPAALKEDTSKGAKKPSSDDASKPVDKPTEEKLQKPNLLSDEEEGDYLIDLKYEPTSDTWRWPNGTEAMATNWMHSLPNAYKSGEAGCVYAKHSKTPVFVNEGKWANWFCDIDAFAIFEKHL